MNSPGVSSPSLSDSDGAGLESDSHRSPSPGSGRPTSEKKGLASSDLVGDGELPGRRSRSRVRSSKKSRRHSSRPSPADEPHRSKKRSRASKNGGDRTDATRHHESSPRRSDPPAGVSGHIDDPSGSRCRGASRRSTSPGRVSEQANSSESHRREAVQVPNAGGLASAQGPGTESAQHQPSQLADGPITGHGGWVQSGQSTDRLVTGSDPPDRSSHSRDGSGTGHDRSSTDRDRSGVGHARSSAGLVQSGPVTGTVQSGPVTGTGPVRSGTGLVQSGTVTGPVQPVRLLVRRVLAAQVSPVTGMSRTMN